MFGDVADVAVDREMVQLAKERPSRYDPSDLEDRYETRLRTMIEAKLKGEGIETDAVAEPDRSNVVDLMAALRKSLAQAEGEAKAAPATTSPAKQKRAAGQVAKAPRKRA